MGRLSNRYVPILSGATISAGTTYYPGTLDYYTNPGYLELVVWGRRTAETGTGSLILTLQQFDPDSGAKYDMLGGAGTAMTCTWAADATNAAGAYQTLRVSTGILGADADGSLAVGTSNWYDMTPPMFWGLKLVEAGTSSTLTLGYYLLRG